MICYKEYVRRKTDKRAKIKKVLAIERGCRCLDCNSTFEPKLLDFHHRDPKIKDFAISRILMGNNLSTLDAVKIESQKCDLLCPICHRIRHYAMMTSPVRPKDKTRLKYKTLMIKAFGDVCWSCEKGYDYFNFDFHHLDESEKDFSLSLAMVKCMQLSKLIEEAKKCAMLCALCHRKLHYVGNVHIKTRPVNFSVFN